ncbi:hypothetical protein PU560_09540 [Georgenia sp. 10Sc9-8]|uniref:Phage tail sheath protein n=1 Tax=Georgenia halotolerans TaxID=3028317 RepID=A0ABT5TXB0_9MICO|nr:hypothetical protein [Georgenia halotolerans]
MSGLGLDLGAPGVYLVDPQERAALGAVRLDVTGFVGVAPRGPVDRPVAVESWSEYLWLFGGVDDGPGGLGTAVHAFFAQGGSRAFVLRVSPLPRDPHPAARAARSGLRLRLAQPRADGGARPVDLELRAASEGTWGDGLRVEWRFTAASRLTATADGTELTLPPGGTVPLGSLLRVWTGPAPDLRWVEAVGSREDVAGHRARTVALDRPVRHGTLDVDVLTATVTIRDTATDIAREETYRGLGLRTTHPSFARRRLDEESRLVKPGPGWPDRLLPPDARLGPVHAEPAERGADRWADVGAESFLGTVDPRLLPVGGVEPIDPDLIVHGVDRMSLEPELGLLCVPDLLWDAVAPAATVDVPFRPRSSRFGPCPPAPAPLTYRPPAPEATLLHGPAALDAALARQRRVVELAEHQRRFVALLDVPARLGVGDVERWRAAFDSSYAAAYLPELRAAPGGGRVRRLAASAAAAGIIAARERRLGLPPGPANELAADAVSAHPVTDTEHDALHHLDVNVFRAERDGFRLTAAHTLSTVADYRQLSVRRLMTMLRLAVERQGQWLAFEPHTEELRREVRWAVTRLLRDLYRDGAFAGAGEDEAFFVRCDDSVTPRFEQEQGRLVAEIGVAPAVPLEFLLLRLSRDAGGAVTVEG